MSEAKKVIFKVMEHGQGIALPSYESDHAAGMDVRAAVPENEPLTLSPGKRVLVPTGLQMALPVGYEAQIRPRSGLAYKHGISLVNSPGTIDADYRGELKILMINLGEQAFTVNRGERIAQMIIAPVVHLEPEVAEELPETERGDGGFGSTGKQ